MTVKKFTDLKGFKDENVAELEALGITTVEELGEALNDEAKVKEIVKGLSGVGPKTVMAWKEELSGEAKPAKETKEEPKAEVIEDEKKYTPSIKPELDKESVRPEFINRIDEIIVFHELTPSDIRQIVELQIGQLKEKMAAMGITIEFTEDFIDYLSVKGYDPAYGARPVKRVLQKELIDALAKKLLDGSLSRDSAITASFRDGQLVLS